MHAFPPWFSYYDLNPFVENSHPNTPVYTNIGGQEYLWIAQEATGKLVQFDAHQNTILATIDVGSNPLPPVFDGSRYIWVASATDGKITRLDAQDVRNVLTISIDSGTISALQLIGDRVWISGLADSPTDMTKPVLTLLDATSGAVLQSYKFGIGVTRVVDDNGIVWVNGADMNQGGRLTV